LFISAFTFVEAQNIMDKAVAKIGDMTITAEEFQQRYELTPIFGKHRKGNTESKKIEFLYSLIAEKLWAVEAEKRGLDTTSVISFTTEAFEKMFVRDELYKQEIKDKIVITPDEMAEGFIRELTKLKVNFLFSEDKDEIFSIYKFLQQGIPFDSILAESPEKDEQKEPVEIEFGKMDGAVEDSLYNLSIGQYTSPIFTPDGWYIFILRNTIQTLMLDDKDKEAVNKKAKKIIEARKTKELYYEFYSEFFKNKKVEVDSKIFKSITTNIYKTLLDKKNNFAINDTTPVYFLAEDVLKVEESLGKDTLLLPFLLFDENPLSTKKTIRLLAFDGFSIEKLTLNNVAAALDYRFKNMVEQELLAREGYKRGLQFLPVVQKEVAIWKENYLTQVLQNQFIDSVEVTQREVIAEYNRTNKKDEYIPMVNIIEVLTADAETSQEVLNKLNAGEDIYKLAEQFSIRKATKKTNGEWGLVSVDSLGEIGEIAAKMEIGELYGPVKLKEGYSIFKLKEKVDKKVVMPEPFEKKKAEITRKLALEKVKAKMVRFTVTLARKYGFAVDLNLLESIEVTNINSCGMRFLGFGGKITAVPLSAPNTEWIEPYIRSQSIIQ
ncbi:MAG: peptidylprolyl isomerase, partial [Ignavibacteriaceae bacterium]|nr:peptidylprolyl isomerase [Ignavibacteriaceae bacterium]